MLVGVVLLACLGIAVVIIAFGRGSSRELLAQHIAAVNARHALPPAENAATIYDRLVAGVTLVGNLPDPNLTPAAYSALMEASRIESCWLGLSPGEQCYRDHVRRMRPMRQWARALASAATRDAAGGHVDAAVEKLHCLIRMGSHLQQQGLLLDFGTGTAIEMQAWSSLGESVMRPDAAEELLRMAEAMPWELEGDCEEAVKLMREVVPLIAETVLAEWTLRERLRNWWLTRGEKSEEEIIQLFYQRLLSVRRGTRLLVALRRYHNANGRWPDSLDEIRTFVPDQALIDPFTEQTLVYKKEADGQFVLYSKGPNGRDDNGVRGGKADDYRIWPRYGIKAP